MSKIEKEAASAEFHGTPDTLGDSFTPPPSSDGPPDPKGIDIWEITNPRSLVNLLPDWAAKNILVHQGRNQKLFSLTEPEMKKYQRANYCVSNETDNMIRMRFWLEYDRVQAQMLPRMDLKNVYSGVVTSEIFLRYFKNLYKCAWILCPPANYLVVMDEALAFGLGKMREILGEDHVKGGKVDVGLARLQFAIWQKIDERKNGAVTQRIEQRNLNLNLHRAVEGAVEGHTTDQLKARVKMLEKLEREALHLPIDTATHEPIEIKATNLAMPVPVGRKDE